MDLLYSELQKIRERPALYFGEKSLMYLYYFIVGYGFGAKTERNFLYKFDEFICSYYCDKLKLKGIELEIFRSTKHWRTIISEQSGSQEKAFDKFYELLDEYVKTLE